MTYRHVIRDRRYLAPYSIVFDRAELGSLARIDGRTHHGRRARDLMAELTQYVGGAPRITQRLLIERIVKMSLQLDALEGKITEGQAAGTWTPYDQRTYARLLTAHRLALRELDRMKLLDQAKLDEAEVEAAPPSLEVVIEQHRGRSPKAVE